MRFKTGVLFLSWAVLASAANASVPTDTPEQIVALYPEAEAKVRAQDHEGAIALYQRIVAMNPILPDAWNTLASELYAAKRYEESTSAYLKSLQYGGTLAETILYNIACNYALSGKKAEALDYLDKAMKRGFAQINLVRTDEDLKLIREEPKYKELALIYDTSKMSREEGWALDIDILAREVKRIHSAPFKHIKESEFDSEVKRIRGRVKKASDMQIAVDLVRLMARIGDGHTFAAPGTVRGLPLRFFDFEDGIYIVEAAEEHDDLLWAKVEKIGGVPVAQILAKIEPTVSRDNAMNVKAGAARRLSITSLLNTLGVIPSAESATLSIIDRKGTARDVEVKAGPEQVASHNQQKLAYWPKDASLEKPLFLRNMDKPYWFEYLPEQKAMYLQYNSVRNDPKEDTATFTQRLFTEIDKLDVDKLIVDIRWNGGGNTFLHRPLVKAIIRSKLNSPGHLFVITGRNTFSAAQNFANYVERSSDAVFVGEPTGSSLNFIGETNLMTLPYSKMVTSISNRIWYGSHPLDARVWIAPRIYTPPTMAAIKEGRDLALEAILKVKAP